MGGLCIYAERDTNGHVTIINNDNKKRDHKSEWKKKQIKERKSWNAAVEQNEDDKVSFFAPFSSSFCFRSKMNGAGRTNLLYLYLCIYLSHTKWKQSAFPPPPQRRRNCPHHSPIPIPKPRPTAICFWLSCIVVTRTPSPERVLSTVYTMYKGNMNSEKIKIQNVICFVNFLAAPMAQSALCVGAGAGACVCDCEMCKSWVHVWILFILFVSEKKKLFANWEYTHWFVRSYILSPSRSLSLVRCCFFSCFVFFCVRFGVVRTKQTYDDRVNGK